MALFSQTAPLGAWGRCCGGRCRSNTCHWLRALVHVPLPRSTTHCELVGIKLAARAQARVVFSDSLSALVILRDWGKWPLSRKLKCVDRAEVRAILHASTNGVRLLEKVKAHRMDSGAPGDAKVFWNDIADKDAKHAASDCTTIPIWTEESRFADHVQVLDENRRWILSVPEALLDRWWRIGRLSLAQRRPDTLGILYPPDVSLRLEELKSSLPRPHCSWGKVGFLCLPRCPQVGCQGEMWCPCFNCEKGED